MANDALLSAAAGIMLAACFVSLLAPGIESALALGGGRASASEVRREGAQLVCPVPHG